MQKKLGMKIVAALAAGSLGVGARELLGWWFPIDGCAGLGG